MVAWQHRLDRHEYVQILGDSKRQGSLACCSPWGHKSWTRLSDWTELNWVYYGKHMMRFKVH